MFSTHKVSLNVWTYFILSTQRGSYTVKKINAVIKSNMTSQAKRLKIVLIGDGGVGKTCLLTAYTENQFPDYYTIPTLFENYTKNITVDNQEYSISLWDTGGLEDFDKLRPLTYPDTDCFLLFYSASSKASYENVTAKWIHEVRLHNPQTPIVLVATKIDLRNNPNEQTITKKEGQKLMRKIKAQRYIECSAKEHTNLNYVFEKAVRYSVEKKIRRNSKSCILQ